MQERTCAAHHRDPAGQDAACPRCATAFDVALAELLRCWAARDDLRRRGDATLEEVTAAWLALDRARRWVASFDGAGRHVGLGTR